MKRWGMLLIVVVAGCRKEDAANAPKVGATADAAPAAKADPPKPALPWATDNEASYAALQGAWVVTDFGSVGRVEAWNVEGHKVTVYDAKDKTETPDELVFNSPCSVRLKEAGWGGTFVKRADGSVHLGLGGGGFKIGENLAVCMRPGMIWLTPAGCQAFGSSFGEWEARPDVTCGIQDREVFAKIPDEPSAEMDFVDDSSLMYDQLAANRPTKMADFAAARAEADRRQGAVK